MQRIILFVSVFLLGVVSLWCLSCGDEEIIEPMGTAEMSLTVDCGDLTANFGTVKLVLGQADYIDLMERIQFIVPIDDIVLDCGGTDDPELEIGPVLLPAGRFAAILQVIGTGPCASRQYQLLELATVVCDTSGDPTTICETSVRPMACPYF